ncbi:MAG: hypothetical protein F6J93_00770 [Oscillatoria sp. SIO1A7]|nr:hypothetical protein [Oscillatoria sp. SIO1A7]
MGAIAAIGNISELALHNFFLQGGFCSKCDRLKMVCQDLRMGSTHRGDRGGIAPTNTRYK